MRSIILYFGLSWKLIYHLLGHFGIFIGFSKRNAREKRFSMRTSPPALTLQNRIQESHARSDIASDFPVLANMNSVATSHHVTMAGHCSTLLQPKFLHSSLFVDQCPMSSSVSSNSNMEEDERSVHRGSRQYLGGSSSMDCLSSTHLANEARFSVDERLFLSAALDEGGASVAHHRWQQTSPLVTLLSSASQRSLRSVDSCPEMPRRGEDGRIERTDSIDMASRFLARQERQAGPRDGGKSFYLNMMASNQHNASSLDIDLYRPVGFNINEIRRRRSIDMTPAIDLHKPLGLPVGLDIGTQPVKVRRHSFDLAPCIPTRSAPDSPVSAPRSSASSTMADNPKLLSFNQIMPAIQIAKEAQHSIRHRSRRHADDESSISSEDAAEDASVVSSQESDIIADNRDLDDFDLDEDFVDHGSSMRCERRGHDSKPNDSGSESDLSDEEYRAVGKRHMDSHSQSRRGNFSAKRNHSSVHGEPEQDNSNSTEEHSPSRAQMDPIEQHRARPRSRRARSSEPFTVNSSPGPEIGKNKWRECLERSKARRNARSFEHVHPRTTSIPSRSSCI